MVIYNFLWRNMACKKTLSNILTVIASQWNQYVKHKTLLELPE